MRKPGRPGASSSSNLVAKGCCCVWSRVLVYAKPGFHDTELYSWLPGGRGSGCAVGGLMFGGVAEFAVYVAAPGCTIRGTRRR